MKLAYTLPLIMTSLFASTPSESALELYTNTAFLKQRFDVGSGSFTTFIPSSVTLEKLQLKSTCNIEKKELKKAEDLDDNLQNLINEAKEELKNLQQQSEVLKAKKALLKTLSLEKANIDEVQNTTTSFGELLLQNLQSQNDLNKEIKEAKERLNALLQKRSNSKTKALHVELSCDAPSNLEITYNIPNVRVERLTKFDAESINERLSLSQNAYISHSLGVDLEDVHVKLYSFAYNRSLTPTPFYPRYIDLPRQRVMRAKTMSKSAVMMDNAMPEMAMMANAKEVQLLTKRAWEASGIDLKSGQKNEVTFNTQELPFSLSCEIDGYSSASAFAKVSFTPQNTIEAGSALFVLDGTMLGKRYIKREDKEKKTHLFFGKNELINVKKELQKDFTDDSLLSSNQTTEKIWKYTITNRSNKKEDISLKERLPISKHEDIKIKPLGDKSDSISIKGEVLWSFTLQAGEKKEITYGYSVKKPRKK